MSDASPLADRVGVSLHTLGCKVNQAEGDAIAADLLGDGASIVDDDAASVIVINTCTVTREADAKARKAVRHALKAGCRPVVVVTGCLAAFDGDALRMLGERVVVEADKERVALRVAELLGLDSQSSDDTPPAARTGEGFRTRAMLKVEDGCDNFCSYCIVPYVRGGPRALALASAVAEAESLVAAGTREIVLTGINLGRYRDAETGADLADLIAGIAETGVSRLRLSSIEPPDLTDRLLGVLAETPAVCEHLHVPLQSGSDAVLSAMGRGYTAERFARRIAAARVAMPGLAVTTDLIAGFPGETAEHHAESLVFVERMGFAKLHVFRYSARPGTLAASLEQVAPETRSARGRELRTLGSSLRERYVASRVGSEAEVLVETVENGRATGTTRDYLRVELDAPDASRGQLRMWTVTARGVVTGRRG